MNALVGFLCAYSAIVTGIAVAEYVIYRWQDRQMRDQLEAFRENRADDRAGYTASLEALANAVHYGAPTKPEAQVISPEPDAEERATRAFGASAIEAGVKRLRQEYERAGVAPDLINEEALRSEAIAMLGGQSPRVDEPFLFAVRD